jgi:hypothetical protein
MREILRKPGDNLAEDKKISDTAYNLDAAGGGLPVQLFYINHGYGNPFYLFLLFMEIGICRKGYAVLLYLGFDEGISSGRIYL